MISIDVSKYFTCMIYGKRLLNHFFLANPSNVLIFTDVENQKEFFLRIFSLQNDSSRNVLFLGERYQISKCKFFCDKQLKRLLHLLQIFYLGLCGSKNRYILKSLNTPHACY